MKSEMDAPAGSGNAVRLRTRPLATADADAVRVLVLSSRIRSGWPTLTPRTDGAVPPRHRVAIQTTVYGVTVRSKLTVFAQLAAAAAVVTLPRSAIFSLGSRLPESRYAANASVLPDSVTMVDPPKLTPRSLVLLPVHTGCQIT